MPPPVAPRSGGVRPADNEIMDEREMMRFWVRTWKEAGPELEAIRRREIHDADNLKVLALLWRSFRPIQRLQKMEVQFADRAGLLGDRSGFQRIDPEIR